MLRTPKVHYKSSEFDFNGKFYGTSQSNALNIVRADSPASNGTYTWSVSEQLIYPSCNAANEGESVPTTMPIAVVAKDTGSFELN